MQVEFIDLKGVCCRTCGVNSKTRPDPFFRLFEDDLPSRITDLFSLLQFNFKKDDGLPQYICNGCLQTFQTIEEFCSKCKEIQELLLAIAKGTLPEQDEKHLVVLNMNGGDGSLGYEVNFLQLYPVEIQTECTTNAEILAYEIVNATPQDNMIDCSDIVHENNESFQIELNNNQEDVNPSSNEEDNIKDCSDIVDENNESFQTEINENQDEVNSSSSEEDNDVELPSELDGNTTTENTIKPERVARKKKKGNYRRKWATQTCKFCKLKFTRVRSHIKICLNRNVELCKYCDIEIPTVEELNRHIDEMHPNKLPSCSICLTSFKNFMQRSTHRWNYHNDRNCRCEICDRNFLNPYRLIDHNLTVHSEVVNRECPTCKRVLKTQYQYECHLGTHDPELRKYNCSLCGIEFKELDDYKNHELTHVLGEQTYLCDICGQPFTDILRFRKHQEHEHGTMQKKSRRSNQPNDSSSSYACNVCGEKLSSYQTLYAHKRQHKQTNMYPCPIAGCSKIYASQLSLRRHLTMKHVENENGEKEFRFKCTVCSRGFNGSASLAVHMKCHQEDRKFKCDHCGSAFKRNSHLVSHTKRMHIKDLKFSCEHCDLKFANQYELNMHLVVHKDNRSLKCPECPASFKWKGSLRVHMLRHSDNKPHQCTICKKSFLLTSQLETHIVALHPAEQLKTLEDQVLKEFLEEPKAINETIYEAVSDYEEEQCDFELPELTGDLNISYCFAD